MFSLSIFIWWNFKKKMNLHSIQRLIIEKNVVNSRTLKKEKKKELEFKHAC